MFKGKIELKGSYKLNIEEDWLEVCNELEHAIYYEYSDGHWAKYKYDENGNQIYYEDSKGYWFKNEFDNQGNRIYYEDSEGAIFDNRPKVAIELTQEQLDKIKHLL
jgi:hypothetical protein